MRWKHTFSWIWLPAALGCSSVLDDPQVDYGDAKPLGSWNPPTAQTTFETQGLGEGETSSAEASAAGAPALPTVPATTRPVGTSTGQAQQGPTSAAGAPATGSAGAAAHSGGSQKPQTGSAGAGAAAPSGGEVEPDETPVASGGLTKLELNYTTESLGGRYSPKNVGAIWVTDSSGKLVKSLEVWARTRLRYLLNYAEARASARVDVTATATLTNHKAHTATWDFKDASGAAVPAGKYTLHAEVTDSHADGKTITVPFDTSAGATTLSPPDSPGFVGMKLVLQ